MIERAQASAGALSDPQRHRSEAQVESGGAKGAEAPARRLRGYEIDALDRRLLNEFQQDFPLADRPYAVLGERLGLDEDAVMDRLARLSRGGTISRVGAVFRPHAVGGSTLAAMAVPEHRLDEVADLVNAFPEVNHNYQREHRLNLWFVVTAPSQARVAEVLAEISRRAGLRVLDLPLLEHFHIDLGFDLKWT
ncbi:AsnC family transcriptional regulator [Paramagnetospirillum magneticum]|uniref:siroheme decarboxylase n=1 Tax=Paramagnetospirillum magneticum (strain ATCC 700264 / AMB-1) TaxID=342108 RepID=Q2W7G8_PARM1|nr:AsnC family transcriptional regulator [Paramagnetospirillum magneticum]BAE50207.1 Transcriptional regulator [Paramagnetospirillum magneticum AMB-1]